MLIVVSIWFWSDHDSLQTKIDDQSAQINNLNLQISELQKEKTDNTTQAVTLSRVVGPEIYSANVSQSGGFLSSTVSKLAWIGAGWANSNSEYLKPADNYLINSFYEGYGQSNMMSVSCRNGYEIISYSTATGNKLTISPTNTEVSIVIEDQPYNNIFITCEKQ